MPTSKRRRAQARLEAVEVPRAKKAHAKAHAKVVNKVNEIDALVKDIAGGSVKPAYRTKSGAAFCGDSKMLLGQLASNSINLVMTSPPFALLRKKEYGNEEQAHYIEWFMGFAEQVHRVLKDDGSFVIDIGGSWNPGHPTRSLYHFKLLIALCEQQGFHLAEEFFWYNPSKLPSPAQWVNVERIRAKDAVNCVWWLSKTERPKADNRRVLQPYSDAMLNLLENGYKAMKRPSGWAISTKFSKNNGGSIPPNILIIPNTDSNGSYIQRCRDAGMQPHPARFPPDLPRFFVKFLTEENDVVLDIFGGSNQTGKVADEEGRQWLTFELDPEYVEASKFRWDDYQFLM
jgi:DNA modification methylase